MTVGPWSEPAQVDAWVEPPSGIVGPWSSPAQVAAWEGEVTGFWSKPAEVSAWGAATLQVVVGGQARAARPVAVVDGREVRPVAGVGVLVEGTVEELVPPEP